MHTAIFTAALVAVLAGITAIVSTAVWLTLAALAIYACALVVTIGATDSLIYRTTKGD